jgi:beta-galactosidase
MCLEDFNRETCTILKDALGITGIQSDTPFVNGRINAFHYQDVPVSFVETYTGIFDEVFATNDNEGVVGFVKTMGKGKVMMLAAALSANTLDDLDIVHQMALKMGCQPLFQLDNWADVRISHGPKGNFLFINNYQDDPVETAIVYLGKSLVGGNKVYLPARRGLILPLNWQITADMTLHYVTSEIVKVIKDGTTVILKTAQNEFYAEMTLPKNFHCDEAVILKQGDEAQHIRVCGKEGMIMVRLSEPTVS